METSATFTVDIAGITTGTNYAGKFTAKTILSRRDRFRADEIRRTVLGTNSAGAPAALNGEAYMIGMLAVRILEAPQWWQDSDSGQDLTDINVIGELFRITSEKEDERQNEIKVKAKESLEKLSKSKKITSNEG